MVVSLKMLQQPIKLLSADTIVTIGLLFFICPMPHLLVPLHNLCLSHLWHQPAHRHLCQAWQPKPRRSAWLSSIDSFRQLHPDSDLYGGFLIYRRPLLEGSLLSYVGNSVYSISTGM